MKKLVSYILSVSMMCSAMNGLTSYAASVNVGDVVFKHQNVVGSQTCYADDTAEKEIEKIPNVIQGMRINQPVFRAYMDAQTAGKTFDVKQLLKNGKVLKSEKVTATNEGVLEFKHIRNCEMIEIVYNNETVASIDTEKEYINGVAVTYAPMSYQIFQRDENNKAEIVITGSVSDAKSVSVSINEEDENVPLTENEFTYTKSLDVGLYDITVKSDKGDVAIYEQVGVGDIWVAAGQSNMTDMGAITDGFKPDTDDPINDNMHIIYAEDCTWHKMTHPSGEGRFFKTGIRTSPVTSFAREISESENVPIGIVQSSVGGTNIYQWVKGVRDSDANSGYLFEALKSCFDKMPSAKIKGVLWYQGCNDAIKESYAYDYKNLQAKVFDEMHNFFGKDTPIITTQLNDANQDSNSSQGYYDAWSYVKDVQRQNEELYDNVYVVGTGELELGDTIHNSAVSNVKLGKKWANAAKNIAYGDTSVNFRQPTIDSATVSGDNEITLTFKNTNGLKTISGTKRIGITNSLTNIVLGDLKKEFVVRSGGNKVMTASNSGKGTELTITNAEIVDKTKVILKTKEELSGIVAVDCMYGKRFTPTLADETTNESVLSFYNVIAECDSAVEKENTFGNSYIEVKEFSTSPLAETLIGNTGFKISTTTSNWNNVVVRDKSSTNSGYYPYKDGLDENGYYLFIGSGGNSGVSAKLTLPDTISADKYIKITYAKPKATNNGSTERSSGNNVNTVTVGNEVIDLQNNCEFDKWYTTTIKTDGNISYIDFNLGKWSAVAVSGIEIVDSADTLELTSEETEKYITPENQTVQMSAKVYKSITTIMGKNEITAKGNVDENADVEYSVNGYEGVSIDKNGLLTITNTAKSGIVKVSAKYNGIEKSLNVTLKSLGNATDVEIFGDEVIKADESKKYTAIPSTDGTVIPKRDTKWEIIGDTDGVSIDDDGVLTVEENAENGVIKIKATLILSNIQTTEISSEFSVTVRNSKSKASPYTIRGLILKDGATEISKATGISNIIIDKTDDTNDEYAAIVKVFDENSKLIDAKTVDLNGLSDGVQAVDFEMELKNANFAKAYIAEKNDEQYDNGGNPYEILKVEKNNSNITKAVIMKNTDENETAAQLIVAQYKDNVLKSTAIKNISLANGRNTINIDEPIIGSNVKVFLWNDIGGLIPLAQPISQLSESDTEMYSKTVSDNILVIKNGEYTNVPLVADWITGAKSGLGMGAGIISPKGVPYGIDPELVDVSTLNVNYTYDENYPTLTTDNALWYKTGAFLASANGANNSIYARDGADWEQKALPIGNGYMGGMLFGLPDKDQIQINEETFWAAGYRGTQNSVNSNTVNKNMSEGINGYMSVGNIFVDFNMPKGATVKNYYRDLNLDESVAHVKYEYDGVKYNREYFASYPKEVLVFRYTSDSEMNFDVKPVSMHPGKVTVNDGEITIIGKLKDSEPYSSGGNAAWNQESDLEYCTKVKVIADNGSVADGYNTVNVSGATGVTIIVAAATDYDSEKFILKDDGSVDMTQTPYKSERGVLAAIEKANTRINDAAEMSYDQLKAEHIADYKSQFDKVKFSLTDNDEICQIPTDELQSSYNKVVGTTAVNGVTKVSYDENAYENLNKHLEELHYNYARYLMISSSRSQTMPATLQGKWCQSVAEIWGSCYCININMEMNYWFAGGANLTDSGMALVKWFNSQIPAGRVTAKNMYKITPKSYTFADGKMTFANSSEDKDDVFIMHTKQAIMGTTDMTGSTSIQSPGNTAWLMYNLWDLYQTSGDKKLLEDELYPIMRKAANFYTQYLYTNMKRTTTDTEKYPDGYYYTTWEGRSPEQGPTHEGIKYDLQLVAGMYDYTIKAAEILEIDEDKVNAWKEIRNHLEIPVELGDDGQIKEWAEETTYNTDASGNALGDPVHRHISHLVGLYPGNLINRDTPELLEGARIVLENRGDDSTGWSCSNKFLLRARTLEGDKALEMFRYQLAKKTYSNLFDTHAPFQIDGNFGSAAGVMELLMQSHTGDIYILPALPKAWNSGEISGIKAKNGAEVSIKWDNGKATEIKIIPAVDGDITIGYEKDNALMFYGTAVEFNNDKYTIENAVAGEEYIFVTE